MLVLDVAPVRAGIGLLPAVCLLVPGAAGVSALITRLGRFRWAIWVGWGITTCACGVFITFDTYTSTAVFVVALAAFGIGNGMVLTGVNVGIQALSADHDAAIAASMYGFMRSLGMPFGVAVGSNVVRRCGEVLTAFQISATVYQNSLLGDFESFGIAPASGRSAILASQTRGIQSVFVMMTAVSASALIVSFAIRGTSMDKIHRSIFRPR
jgi:fucose permease